MKRVATSLLFTVLLLAAPSIIAQQSSHPFTVGDLLKVRRVSDPQVSPKGDMIAYTFGDVDRNANKIITQIYVVPIGGGEARQLTNALQRQEVDSRLPFFPDKGHWILKPQNSELWYTTVLQWFNKHLK